MLEPTLHSIPPEKSPTFMSTPATREACCIPQVRAAAFLVRASEGLHAGTPSSKGDRMVDDKSPRVQRVDYVLVQEGLGCGRGVSALLRVSQEDGLIPQHFVQRSTFATPATSSNARNLSRPQIICQVSTGLACMSALTRAIVVGHRLFGEARWGLVRYEPPSALCQR